MDIISSQNDRIYIHIWHSDCHFLDLRLVLGGYMKVFISNEIKKIARTPHDERTEHEDRVLFEFTKQLVDEIFYNVEIYTLLGLLGDKMIEAASMEKNPESAMLEGNGRIVKAVGDNIVIMSGALT